MTARVTIRPGSVTWSTVKPPTDVVSVVIGGVRVTVEPLDAQPATVQASGAGGTTCDEVLQQMASA